MGIPVKCGRITDEVRDPLVAPLAAIAAGIVLNRWVAFEPRDTLAGIAALSLVSLLCLWLSSPFARGAGRVACLIAFLVSGIALSISSRPSAAIPALDVPPRELVTLEGCVVEPSTLGREPRAVCPRTLSWRARPRQRLFQAR